MTGFTTMKNISLLGSAFVGSVLFLGCFEKEDAQSDEDKLPDCCQAGTSRANLLAESANSATSGASPESEVSKPIE
mgnify:FL=1